MKNMIHYGTIEIETERLYLRPFRYSDDDDMLKHWISDPKIQSMISEPIYSTKEEVRELLDKYITSYQNDDYYRWAIVKKDSLDCIGQIAIYLVNEKNHWCEIEYCLGSQFHRNGFTTEATNAIMDFAFAKMNIHKMQVCHKEHNIASKGVILKCGFTYDGTIRDYFYMDDKYVNRCYYSMLKSEWENIRKNQTK